MPEPLLHESFARADLPSSLRWYCEPRQWAIDQDRRCLRIEPDAGTDFWQRTHYAMQADNGHFLFAEVSGDFILSTHVGFRPVHQYDQAGLMVRLSPDCWLKTSVEYEPDGHSRLGAVATNAGYSDWSTQPFASGPGEVWLRIRREGDDFIVDASPNGRVWQQIRLTHLSGVAGAPLCCGLYACSPRGAGFVAEFSRLSIESGRLS